MEIEVVLNRLRQDYYPIIYPQTSIGTADNPIETICSDISNKIVAWLTQNFPELVGKVKFRSGVYVGEGTEFSGGNIGTSHSWVEIEVPEGKIIIDGSYAQFFPRKIPLDVKKRIRLAIFYPQDERQRWYGNHWRIPKNGKQTSSSQ